MLPRVLDRCVARQFLVQNAFDVDIRATVELGGGVTTTCGVPRANRAGARVAARRVRATFAKTEGRAKRAPTCATPLYRAACVTLRNFKSWQHPEVFPGGPPPQY